MTSPTHLPPPPATTDKNGDTRQGRAGDEPRADATRGRVKAALAFALSAGIASGLAEWAWKAVPRSLSVTTNVIGSTTFNDFNVFRYHDAYYLLVFFLPVVITGIYLTVTRWGPLSFTRLHRSSWPPSFDNALLEEQTNPSLTWAGAALKVALPAAVIGFAVSATSVTGETRPRAALLAATAYVVLILAAVGIRLRMQRAGVRGHHVRDDRTALTDILASTNAIGCAFIPLGVYWVSRNTSLTVESIHRTTKYSWLPLWIALMLVIAVAAIIYSAEIRWRIAWRRIEAATICVVGGSAALYLIFSQLTGAMGAFSGFDDSHYLVGSQLTFDHGYLPWRDIYLLHGPLYDDLYGILGIHLFAHGRWGAANGMSLIVYPLAAVSLFVFAAYFLRRSFLAVSCVGVAIALTTLPSIEPRFVLLPPLIILLDRVLRSRSNGLCAVFAFTALIVAILTPEVALLAIGLFGILPVFEFVHRDTEVALVDVFYRTVRCLAWAVTATVLWIAVLLSIGALPGFVDYFLTAIPGHALEGAFPYGSLSANPVTTVELFLPPVLIVMTYWRSVRKLLERSTWSSRDWILVACATMTALYYTKGLDRIDSYHVYEVFAVSLPLLILWVGIVLDGGDQLVARLWRGLPISSLFSLVGLLAVIAFSPLSLGSVLQIAPRYHGSAPTTPPPTEPKLGYTYPSAVDLAQIDDLRAVLDRYAGPRGAVYDFSNDAGVTNYLLGRVPGTRFYDPALAQTPLAQSLLIDDLKHSRPPVVIFNNDTFGLFSYDGITSMVREYAASQYILDHYRPLLDTHGQLIFIRDDLATTAPPPPLLTQAPSTTDLYFDMPSCDWGDIPDFFAVPSAVKASKAAVPLTLGGPSKVEAVSMSGWVFDSASHAAFRSVAVVADGQIIAEAPVTGVRPDVRAFLHDPAALNSGFALSFKVVGSVPWTLYAITSQGRLIPATGMTPSKSALSGHLDQVSDTSVIAYDAALSAPGSWSTYTWLKLYTPGAFGTRDITITDSSGLGTHSITLRSLPRVGGTVFLRVGGCIQWHGYRTSDLTITVSGTPIELQAALVK